MSNSIRVRNLSKEYRLGLTHPRSVRDLANKAVARFLPRTLSTSPVRSTASRIDDSGTFHALRDINFDINSGEVVGIIGKNGAGKSTLLKILSRITLPSSGRVEIRGRVASLLEVGTGFHPELTGRENIYMNGTILGMTKREIDRSFDAIVDFAGIEGFVDTPVKRYSSGMIVRLGFSVAAHLEPEILIIDEVLAVGDAQFQKRCLGKLDDVAKTGRTVLFVSHSIPAIRRLTTKCILLDKGVTTFEGDTKAALDRYLTDVQQRQLDRLAVATLERPPWVGDESLRFAMAENMTPSIEGDEDICLSVAVKANVNMKYQIGITLHGLDGEAVATGFTDFVVSKPEILQQHFTLNIRNPRLTPGKYWFTIGLLRDTSQIVDVVTEVLHFQVAASATQEEWLLDWNPRWGATRLEMQCEITR